MTLSQPVALAGHYSIDGIVYATKHQAVQAANGNLNKIQYHYHDQLYCSFDWTQEPEHGTSLDEFYRRRAQQLREKYDYLVLMYSGGPDSQNVLDSFVDNNIFLDEIVNFNSYDQTEIVDSTMNNADYIYNVKPTLAALTNQKGLKTKITILSEIELVLKYFDFCRNVSADELAIEPGGPSISAYRPYTLKSIPHIWSKIIGGQRVGMIHGSEKPNLIVQNGRWAVQVYDGVFGNYGSLADQDQDLRHFDSWEMFYTSPDTIPLQIKQAHSLKNFMTNCSVSALCSEQQAMYSNQFESVQQNKRAYTCETKYPGMYLKYWDYHKTIYPKYKIGRFVTAKHKAPLIKPDLFWLQKIQYQQGSVAVDSIKSYIAKHMNVKTANIAGMPICKNHPIFIE